jgi:hypothetical protein
MFQSKKVDSMAQNSNFVLTSKKRKIHVFIYVAVEINKSNLSVGSPFSTLEYRDFRFFTLF